jgi:4-hydroxy 2-oxovalerate aldolase
MQMSNALSQEFLKLAANKRNVVVDSTISGMGRGAGNTPTELIVQYMISQMQCGYNLDAVLDIIDNYMNNIQTKCNWGYSPSYFIAGCYSAHVNNISYLRQKNSIRSKDIRYILNKLTPSVRKRYEYDLLEKIFVQYMKSDIDDSQAIITLGHTFDRRNITIIAPGNSAYTETETIKQYIHDNDTITISINFIHDALESDYLYLSNVKRYAYLKNISYFDKIKKIYTSNINIIPSDKDIVVSFTRLVKCGWEHLDNSAILLLRLLDNFSIKSIGIAGLDGYNNKADKSNYARPDLELSDSYENPAIINQEIQRMLDDYLKNRKSNCEIKFITQSRFVLNQV